MGIIVGGENVIPLPADDLSRETAKSLEVAN